MIKHRNHAWQRIKVIFLINQIIAAISTLRRYLNIIDQIKCDAKSVCFFFWKISLIILSKFIYYYIVSDVIVFFRDLEIDMLEYSLALDVVF